MSTLASTLKSTFGLDARTRADERDASDAADAAPETSLSFTSSGGARTPPLPRDWSSIWLVLLVSAAMGFLGGLAVAAASGADALARSWTDDLSSRATVALSIEHDDQRALAEALSMIRRVDGVIQAQPLDDRAMTALLSPWLGEGEDAADLPLPRLIDVATAPGADPIAAIQQGLADLGVEGTVDAHGEWVARLKPAADRLRSLAYGALVVTGIAAALTVALACSAGLAAQARVIDVLKLVGAEDGYISRIFVRRLQTLAFGGSAIGAAVAALTLLGAAGPDAPSAELAPLLPSLTPQGGDWVQFTAIPLAFALIATVSARIAVSIALRRREP